MAGPYQFPTNGKQPVILGPNGMPHVAPTAANAGGQAAASAGQAPQQQPPQGTTAAPFEDGTGALAGQSAPFDYAEGEAGKSSA